MVVFVGQHKLVTIIYMVKMVKSTCNTLSKVIIFDFDVIG